MSASAVAMSSLGCGEIIGIFEVKRDGAFAAIEHGLIRSDAVGFLAVDGDDIRAEVRKQHGGKWAGAEAFDFDDADALEHSERLSSRYELSLRGAKRLPMGEVRRGPALLPGRSEVG